MHTPGPWTVVDQRGSDDDDVPPVIYIEARGVGHIGQIETIEDARLIAAAPKLLTALQNLVKAHASIGNKYTQPITDYNDSYKEVARTTHAALAAIAFSKGSVAEDK